MYSHLLATHSLLRWLVLVMLVVAVVRAWAGYKGGKRFVPGDRRVASVTARLFEIQFLVGMVLYFVSPVTRHFWSNLSNPFAYFDGFFFGAVHMLLMVAAVGVASVGAAKAKRDGSDHERFKSMALMFTAALVLILVAVPWPGSPLAERPWWRGF